MASVAVAISTVHDGSMYTPSDQEDEGVIKNRQTWLEKQELAMADTTRVHISYDTDNFCRYRIINASNKGEGMVDGNDEHADALVTTVPGQALFLPVADCVATTLFDEEHGVLMLSHLGRHSLEQQGGIKSVEFLVKHFGTNPEHLKVWLSPAPGKQVYAIYKLNNQGMKEAAFEQLQSAGVKRQNVIDSPADTAIDDRYFSHSEFLKGNKQTDGRFAMVAVMSL
ncbi:MAG TPA: polyphenol oxidase family protein [Dongiaceae bacterium]|nr:polyphenol oxidase family protein [Dongiaceae bacterium]